MIGSLIDRRPSVFRVAAAAVGLVAGGYFGIWQAERAAHQMAAEGLVVDFIPVGIPIWALVGAIAGLGGAALLFRARRRASVRTASQRE